MAATSARFSIRNYAAMRRSVEAGESWPLPAEKLPPMSVRRFLWWEDELPKADKVKGEIREAGKEEGKRVRKRPLKGSTVTEASALKIKKERKTLTMPSNPSHLHQESTFPRRTLSRVAKIMTERSKKRLKKKTLKMKQSILTTPSHSILKKKERLPFNAKTPRRVTFSENNSFLCHSTMPSSNGLPQLTNLSKMISEVLSASSAISHEVQPAKQSLQISTISESDDPKEAALSQISMLKSSSSNPCSENTSSLKVMIDLNQAAIDYTEESSSASGTQSVDPNLKEQLKRTLPSVSIEKQSRKYTDADINFIFQSPSYPLVVSSNSKPVNEEMRILEKHSNDFLSNKQIQNNDNEIHLYSKKNQWDLWRSSESTCSEKPTFSKNDEASNMKKVHQFPDLNARKAKALTMRLMGRNVVVGCSNRDFKREAGDSQTVYRKNIYPTDFSMTHQSYPMMKPSQQSTVHNNFLNSIYFKHGLPLVKSKSHVQYHVQESSQHVQKQRSEELPHWLYLAKLQMMNQSSS